jgi:hypothetical protein
LRCKRHSHPRISVVELTGLYTDSNRTSEQVFLRGQPRFIKDLAKEIQNTIKMTVRDVYFMNISPRYHRELRRSIGEIQRKTKALILIHGDGKYNEFNDPLDMSEVEDYKAIVKVVGTVDDFRQARAELEVRAVRVLGDSD